MTAAPSPASTVEAWLRSPPSAAALFFCRAAAPAVLSQRLRRWRRRPLLGRTSSGSSRCRRPRSTPHASAQRRAAGPPLGIHDQAEREVDSGAHQPSRPLRHRVGPEILRRGGVTRGMRARQCQADAPRRAASRPGGGFRRDTTSSEREGGAATVGGGLEARLARPPHHKEVPMPCRRRGARGERWSAPWPRRRPASPASAAMQRCRSEVRRPLRRVVGEGAHPTRTSAFASGRL